MFIDILLTADGLLSTLEQLDKQMLLAVNGSESRYLDRLVLTLTHGATWIPLYISLFYLVLRNNNSLKRVLSVLFAAGLCYLLAGAVDDGIIKPLVARWRPTHDPEIGLMVDIVDGYRGGKYGFFSAHASNTFSIAILFCWIVRSRLLTTALIIWSFTNCWTRLYLGVHYPGDILVGLIWGGVSSSLVYFLYHFTLDRNRPRQIRLNQYTRTGYAYEDCNIPVFVLVVTLAFALLKACFL